MREAIIESITPKIRDYVEKKIFEDNETEEASEENDEEVSLNKEEILELSKLINENKPSNSLIETAYNNLRNSDKKKFKTIINKINENSITLNSNKIDSNVDTQKRNKSMSEKFYEIDLKLLRESVQEEAEAHDLAEKYAEEMDELDMMYEQDEDEAHFDRSIESQDEEADGRYDEYNDSEESNSQASIDYPDEPEPRV